MTTVYIISAPSGSGKSTLVEKARQIVPGLDFSISYTTRPPRGTEQDGREYFFVARSEFEEMVRRDDFAHVDELVQRVASAIGRTLRPEAGDKLVPAHASIAR